MIEREERDGVAVLRLCHGKANAIDLELAMALREAFQEEAEGAARALILTGEGRIFSAGVDLYRVLEGGRGYLELFLPLLGELLRALFLLPKPVVAAINGHAIAGGCLLALAADRRIAATGPWKIGIPELGVGVPFPAAALEIVRWALPSRHLEEVALQGGVYPLEEARRRGLVHEVAERDSLLETALSGARKLASVPAGTFALTKEQLRAPVRRFLERHQEEIDRRVLEEWASPAAERSIHEYVERTLG